MQQPTETELEAIWNALSDAEQGDGWRFILLGKPEGCTLHAGRRFPGNEEALLVTFRDAMIPGSRQLPRGRGFEVATVDLPGAKDGSRALGLIREPQGSLELFVMMTRDVIETLCRRREATAREQMQLFLRRVTTWQEFMQRPGDQLLSAEAETGLVGELLTLEMLVAAGVEPLPAVEAWQGPEDGIQDFVLGSGAIEVKSSVATAGFPAKIGSLEQLDDAEHRPLYLCGQRLSLEPDGETLPDRVAAIRAALAGSGALSRLEVRLLHAGYLDAHREGYTRRFGHLESRLILIDERFPRLTAGTVDPAIRRAVYELDLDLVASPSPTIIEVLHDLGMI